MPMGFWAHLPTPFTILAPMVGVTDTVFRRVVARHGRPEVLYTWFVHCDGLCSPGRTRLLQDLWYSEEERPIVAQIFGARPDTFRETARLLAELKFDGIDLNCGCPDRNVEKSGAGASLIRQPEHLAKLVRATQEGAGPVPISIKTRLGYDRIIVEEWVRFLADLEPAAIILHARTREEMSLVPAHWDAVGRAVAVLKAIGSPAKVVLNGDVTSLAQARQLARETGADGVMVGRGVFGNPWVFRADEPLHHQPRWLERLTIMLEHTRLFDQTYGRGRNFELMKKFYKAYVSDFPDAKDLRLRLMACHEAAEVELVTHEFLSHHGWSLTDLLAGRPPLLPDLAPAFRGHPAPEFHGFVAPVVAGEAAP